MTTTRAIQVIPTTMDPAPVPKYSPGKKRLRAVLAPDRYSQADFFMADITDVASKDDRHSMEHPLFSISKKPDFVERSYEHGAHFIKIKPSGKGLATIWDKDILIFAISQLVEGLNRERADTENRTIRFSAYSYMVATNRATDGREYERLQEALERLRGTTIITNIETGGKRIRRGFGFIDEWEVVQRARDGRMEAIAITLSKWLYNAVQALEVLTMNRAYFRLTGGLERRLYELARKHCGNQARWPVSLAVLHKKSGSTGTLREFRRMTKEIIVHDALPDYRMVYQHDADKVVFTSKDAKALAHASTAQLVLVMEGSPEYS